MLNIKYGVLRTWFFAYTEYTTRTNPVAPKGTYPCSKCRAGSNLETALHRHRLLPAKEAVPVPTADRCRLLT